MTIETKFNIGDEVWFIYGRSVSHGTIKEGDYIEIGNIEMVYNTKTSVKP